MRGTLDRDRKLWIEVEDDGVGIPASDLLLREDPDTSSLCIVAVTAYAMKGDEERAKAAGVDGYVTSR